MPQISGSFSKLEFAYLRHERWRSRPHAYFWPSAFSFLRLEKVRALWYVTFLLAAGHAVAAESDIASDFPSSKTYFQLAQIAERPGSRVHFAQLLEYQCETGARCSDKDLFLIGGDQLITNGTEDKRVYAWYRGRGLYLRGWLPSSKVRDLPFDRNPPLDSWQGTWVGNASRIFIKADPGRHELTIAGQAAWYGAQLGSGEQVVHRGEVEGTRTPEGNRLVIRSGSAPGACVLVLELIGSFLAAVDNRHCGGMNVGFSDSYVRRSATNGAPE